MSLSLKWFLVIGYFFRGLFVSVLCNKIFWIFECFFRFLNLYSMNDGILFFWVGGSFVRIFLKCNVFFGDCFLFFEYFCSFMRWMICFWRVLFCIICGDGIVVLLLCLELSLWNWCGWVRLCFRVLIEWFVRDSDWRWMGGGKILFGYKK